MKRAIVFASVLFLLAGVERSTRAAAWYEPFDGVHCTAYRLGTYELDACKGEEGAER